MKADQIAFYVHNSLQEASAKIKLGLLGEEWVEDIVEGRVRFNRTSDWQPSVGKLQFCYAHGMEIELLTYLEGSHWHSRLTGAFMTGEPFMSHLGYHISADDIHGMNNWPIHLPDSLLVQEMITEKHSNPYLIDRGRTYHYRIYDTRQWLGVYSKFIKRIEKGECA